MKRSLDDQEKLIVRELITNPRLSDNQITRNTNIPLKTVNRKRKKLEEEGYLRYYASLLLSNEGTEHYSGMELYLVTMKPGVTRKNIMSMMDAMKHKHVYRKHVLESFIGEEEGLVQLILIIESYKMTDIIEIFNAEFVPEIKRTFGEDAIQSIRTVRLTQHVNLLHNYMPLVNMNKGVLKEDWPRENVFVEE